MKSSLTKQSLARNAKIVYSAYTHKLSNRGGCNWRRGYMQENGLDKILENNILFVHIPKCGGVSVRESLGKCAIAHFTALELASAMNPLRFLKLFKFAVSRNPWDRLVSAYHYFYVGADENYRWQETNRKWAEKNLPEVSSFDKFVRSWIDERSIHRHVLFRPQHEFTHLPDGTCLVDQVYRLEKIQDLYASLETIMGRTINPKVANRTRERPDYRQAYSDESAEIVANAYAKDIEYFSYQWDRE